MIRNLLLSAFTLFFCNLTFSQSSSPTTETEYNYVTKSYKVQVTSGLDMKAGYNFADLDVVKIGSYTYDIKALIRTEKQEIAALMVITNSATWGNTYYFCIPHGNNDLNQKYFNDLNLWDKAITTPFAYMMSTKFGDILARYADLEKKLKQ